MNQYFHYHPILGLQYFSGEPDIKIDITALPIDYDIEEIMLHMRLQGVAIIDSTEKPNAVEKHSLIITNI